MEVFQPLADFLEVAGEDARIRPVHICLYVVLLEQWNRGGGRSPLAICRRRLMRAAHIGARGTYHRVLRDLHAYGYIRYEPSFDPAGVSLVSLRRL